MDEGDEDLFEDDTESQDSILEVLMGDFEAQLLLGVLVVGMSVSLSSFCGVEMLVSSCILWSTTISVGGFTTNWSNRPMDRVRLRANEDR